MSVHEFPEQRNWPAAVRLTEHALSYLRSAALRAVAIAKVADHLADGPVGVDDLAVRTGLGVAELTRVLRLLAGYGIFDEVGDRVFGLTDESQLLRSDVPGSVRTGLIMVTDDTFWRPAGHLAETVRSGATVFDDIFGSPFFDYLERTGGASDWHRSMASLSGGENDAVATALGIERGQVVDVGGGRGGLLVSILRRSPETTGILFDRDEAIADHLLDRPDLAGRWRTASGDFFDSVPPEAAAYVFKRVLHDWSDDDCVRLLTVVREAMPSTGRVFVVDGIMPDDSRRHPIRTFDLLMMAGFGGRERHEQDFRDLFARAGFELVRITTTEWTMVVVEGRPLTR